MNGQAMIVKKAMTVAAAVGALLLAGAVPALAQDGAEVFQCSDVFPGAHGTIVFGPLGPDGRNVNANCTTPGPAGGGGAAVIECSSFNPAAKGNFVVTPSGHSEGHCQLA